MSAKTTDKLISVSDRSVNDLLDRARREIGQYLCMGDGFVEMNLADELGKTYEVKIWSPGHYVSADEVRVHFKNQGFVGNTAAFIAWVIKHRPVSLHYTVPETVLNGEEGRSYAPFCYQCKPCEWIEGPGAYDLGLSPVLNELRGHGVFIAFREVQ